MQILVLRYLLELLAELINSILLILDVLDDFACSLLVQLLSQPLNLFFDCFDFRLVVLSIFLLLSKVLLVLLYLPLRPSNLILDGLNFGVSLLQISFGGIFCLE